MGAVSSCQQVTYSNKDVETWEGVFLLACDLEQVSPITLIQKTIQWKVPITGCWQTGWAQGSRLSWGADSLYQTQRVWGNPFSCDTVSLVSPVLHCLMTNENFNVNFFNGTHGHYFYHFVEYLFSFFTFHWFQCCHTPQGGHWCFIPF